MKSACSLLASKSVQCFAKKATISIHEQAVILLPIRFSVT